MAIFRFTGHDFNCPDDGLLVLLCPVLGKHSFFLKAHDFFNDNILDKSLLWWHCWWKYPTYFAQDRVKRIAYFFCPTMSTCFLCIKLYETFCSPTNEIELFFGVGRKKMHRPHRVKFRNNFSVQKRPRPPDNETKKYSCQILEKWNYFPWLSQKSNGSFLCY